MHLVVEIVKLFPQLCDLSLQVRFEIIARVGREQHSSGDRIRQGARTGALDKGERLDNAPVTLRETQLCKFVIRRYSTREECRPKFLTRQRRAQLFRQINGFAEVCFREVQISQVQGQRSERTKTTFGDLRLPMSLCIAQRLHEQFARWSNFAERTISFSAQPA